ncbi:uncharacterized protein SPPG_03568 [Spizellomyces punctatus DAOM BR117]|uniref:Uncharacterized protein n=1 Tax=Spizellomyces punctatus (strain DAOM BR117) TaxID=645134 RepID=A0A0L0HJY8_SPIPD|nr:uncharacterized protein SPPG_03568 [Spizellomyces punctatus DAOM BR117]KND01776.1 hypothetical protein SPPG_03568 [Spizellomyces punctatus DAOM BR117]|eukprot:XP_016609815.1 hypothetical protein SPPG_03568 [Spizellomyces punctatus DAOM BR117]
MTSTSQPTVASPVTSSTPRPAIKATATPHTRLQVYVLPTLRNKYVFHARFLKPRSRVEYFALVTAYIFRKWRYQLSDACAFAWHGVGHWAGSRTGVLPSVGRGIWWAGNRMTTRRAADEYFLKSVPKITEHIEFVYPASANAKLIKNQLGEFLANSDRHRSKLFLWALVLPVDLYLAKFHLAIANILFSYNIFRLNASWRSMHGSRTLQKLLDSKAVTWTASKELDEMIQRISGEVTQQIEREVGSQGRVWRWRPDGDLHDDVVEKLERDLKMAELGRTYRRTRLQYYIHEGKEW